MTEPGFVDLSCGGALVQRLLPQRPPFLMVDRVDGFAPGERPAAVASRFLSANDPVFQGHFPDLPVLPGALLVEAAGQCSSVAFTLQTVLDGYVAAGADLERMRADLAELDAAFALRGALRGGGAPELLAAFERLRGLPVGVAGGVRMKFLRPVTPGCRLVLRSRLTHRLGEQLRFEVSAEVDGDLVMEGSLAAVSVEDVALPGRPRA
ncbi:MAG: beta-hydroxyacyl-ACP dehydratase [Alphaproteobacteria bacterium]|nr:beta-hydroxyacyl-ACP dehydratase [Alphaproteobacteria bacterium]